MDGSVWHQEDKFEIGALKPSNKKKRLTFALHIGDAKVSGQKKVAGQAIHCGWKKGMDDLRSHYCGPADPYLAVTLQFTAGLKPTETYHREYREHVTECDIHIYQSACTSETTNYIRERVSQKDNN